MTVVLLSTQCMYLFVSDMQTGDPTKPVGRPSRSRAIDVSVFLSIKNVPVVRKTPFRFQTRCHITQPNLVFVSRVYLFYIVVCLFLARLHIV